MLRDLATCAVLYLGLVAVFTVLAVSAANILKLLEENDEYFRR